MPLLKVSSCERTTREASVDGPKGRLSNRGKRKFELWCQTGKADSRPARTSAAWLYLAKDASRLRYASYLISSKRGPKAETTVKVASSVCKDTSLWVAGLAKKKQKQLLARRTLL